MFRVGDEVVCVDDNWFNQFAESNAEPGDPRKGQTYTVIAVKKDPVWGDEFLRLAGTPSNGGYISSFFRKVQRKTSTLSVSDFLTIKPGQFEEPRRVNAPARKRESVS